jgi:GDP-4-dehydro-6-deoxy-D-mannose reductase
VTNPEVVEKAISSISPTHVLHLAGVSSVETATNDPELAWRVNVGGALNIGRAIVNQGRDCHLLYVGSGLAYGDSAKSGLPLDETAPLSPMDEYGATKAAADLAMGALSKRGLKVVRLRPFNHIGPGQNDAFVVPAFAMQIARIEARLAPPILRVGNLDVERDFLDVRDVVECYALAMREAHDFEAGLIMNVASGIPRRIGDLLEALIARSKVSITIEQDPRKMRANDLPRIIGDSSRAKNLLGWTPKHSMNDTLDAVLYHCRMRVLTHNDARQ